MGELLRKQSQVLCFAQEATYGATTTVAGLDAMLVSDLTVNMIESEVSDRNNLSGAMGAQGGITVSRKITSSFGVEIAGSGTATLPPKWGRLLAACGFAQVVGASNVTYTPVSKGFKSLAALYRVDTLQQELKGTRGKFSINLDSGTIPSFNFDIESLYQDPTVESDALSGIDMSAFKIPVGVTDVETSVELANTPVAMSKLTIDPGVLVEYLTDTEGNSVQIAGRTGSVSMTFRTDAAGLVQAIKDGSNNALGELVAIHGTTPGNLFKVVIPQIQIKKASVSWDGEFAVVDLSADIVPITPNSDMVIWHL